MLIIIFTKDTFQNKSTLTPSALLDGRGNTSSLPMIAAG